MKKTCAMLFAAIAMATLGLQGTANAASTAWPTGCEYRKYFGDDAASEAWCDRSNGGSYKAAVICTPLDGGNDVHHEATAWKRSGISYAFCPPRTRYKSAGIVTRSTH
ncbi:hypothetical protein [Streptomyces sp. DSM 40750]|uniref:hypothetical protein n=1 Tax=Streptomyces sp. DSM 40750 TaxID=2801030 RepID=UPI00214AE4DD|nr:hypothetical protein [Streptomyces sp. DSM 40750]UUU25332.1 hypothetical protein JIX55_36650 [Streptomyces sp. DSM 40750]